MADPLRICVIGNSHMAALRDGWPLVEADHPRLRLSFFGMAQYGLRRVHAEGTRLVPGLPDERVWMRRACGVEVIETAGYDGFVLVGLWRGIRWIEMTLRIAAIAGEAGMEGPGRMLVSFEAAEAAAHDALRRAPLMHILGLLRAMHGDPPVIAVPMPRLAADALSPGAPTAAFADADLCRDAIRRGTAPGWTALHERLMARFPARWPEWVDQPADTIERHILTRPEFRRGAPRLNVADGPQPPEDFNHMNAAYGARVIAMLAPRLLSFGQAADVPRGAPPDAAGESRNGAGAEW